MISQDHLEAHRTRGPDGIRRALVPVHRRYVGTIHARLRRTGHFWQGRLGAVAMDEAHLAAAVRYVALNPVGRASSSKRATGHGPVCARICRVSMTALRLCRRFSTAFRALPSSLLWTPIRTCSSGCAVPSASARPLGSDAFVEKLEEVAKRKLKPRKRGPKPGGVPDPRQAELGALSS